jgi:hypothetical protein
VLGEECTEKNTWIYESKQHRAGQLLYLYSSSKRNSSLVRGVDHITCMSDIISQCKIVEKNESKRQPERSRSRREDDTKFSVQKECKRRYNYNDEVKEDELGKAWNTHGRR